MNVLVCTPGRLLHHLDQTVGFDASQTQVLFFVFCFFVFLFYLFFFFIYFIFLISQPSNLSFFVVKQVLVLDEADRILDLGFSSTMQSILEHLPQFPFFFFFFF